MKKEGVLKGTTACLLLSVGLVQTVWATEHIYYDATFNFDTTTNIETWSWKTDETGITDGTDNPPHSNQNNTFLKSRQAAPSSPALNLSNGSPDLRNTDDGTMTNTITGGLTVSSGVSLRNDGGGTLTNTITGGMTVSEGGADLYNYGSGSMENRITGGMTVSGGWAYLSNNGSGSMENRITGGVTASAGYAVLYNSGSGNLTNTITGGVTVSGRYADLCNYGDGTLTNTLGTVTLDGGEIWIGGLGSDTKIDTFTWNDGLLERDYTNPSQTQGGFGDMHIKTLNLGTGNLTLSIYDNTYDGLSKDTTTHTLFTADAINGGRSDITMERITLANENSTFEIASAGFQNGITNALQLTGDGAGAAAKFTITMVPVATTPSTSGDQMAADSASDMLTSVQNISSNLENQFTSSPAAQAAAHKRMAKAVRENGDHKVEALINAMTQEDSLKMVKFKGDFRVFAAPYATRIRNQGAGGYKDGFSEKYYGLLLGASHYVKDHDINLTAMVGAGLSKTEMQRSVHSNTNGKSIMAGVGFRKTFIKALDVESNLSTMVVKKNQARYGEPVPGQGYIARANFNTYALSSRTETGYIFKLGHGFSVKPDIGLQLNLSKRTKIQERGAPGKINQYYRQKISKDGEVYGGIGVRKQWQSDHIEGKITAKYEVGKKSGNGKSTSTLYTDGTPNGVTYSGKKPGNMTHYVSVYGSVLHKKANWKIVPGTLLTFQKGQKSMTGTVKLEYRW